MVMSDPNKSSEIASQMVTEVQARMLAAIRQDTMRATKLALLFIVIFVPIVHWVNGNLTQTITLTAVLIGYVAVTWTHFLMTRYRINKNYFGSNEVEAAEIIAFLHKDQGSQS
jgi:hypothetical protein